MRRLFLIAAAVFLAFSANLSVSRAQAVEAEDAEALKARIDVLERKRLYEQAAKLYAELVPKVSQPGAKQEIEKKQRINSLYIRAKQSIIEYVKKRGGITVRNLGYVEHMDVGGIRVRVGGQATPAGWNMISDRQFTSLLGRAIGDEGEAHVHVAYALMLAEQGNKDKADEHFSKALAASPGIRSEYPEILAEAGQRAAKASEEQEKRRSEQARAREKRKKPARAAARRVRRELHPRMAFFMEDIPLLRKQAHSTHAQIWRPILRNADKLLNSSPPPPPTKPGLDASKNVHNVLRDLAFAYVITGDDKYGEATRKYLLAFAKWPYWGFDRKMGDRDLSLAFVLSGYALAYDWVFNYLPEQDRATAREVLGRHAQEMYEAATQPNNPDWMNWWSKSYMQNHWYFNNSGLGLAALALEAEDERAGKWLDHVIEQFKIDKIVRDGIKDGTWHEGPQYQNSISLILPFLYCLKRSRDLDLCAEEYMQNFVMWRMYNYLPPGSRKCVLPFSSYVKEWGGVNVGGGLAILRFVAGRYKNGYAEWLVQQYLRGGTHRLGSNPFGFLYYDPTVTPVPPADLPHDRTFPDLAAVIWRTGWESKDLAFGLKTGAPGGRFAYDSYFNRKPPFDKGGGLNVGHNHADTNTFTIFRGDTDLACEVTGRSTVGRASPAPESRLHNTLLIDGKGQVWTHGAARDTDGRLEGSVGSPALCYLMSDANNRYREGSGQFSMRGDAPGKWLLKVCKRYVVFVKPHYFVMVDNIVSDAAHQYEWLCHFSRDGAVSVDGDWVKGTAGTSDILGVKVLAPRGFLQKTGNDGRPFVRISTAGTVPSSRFVTVLYPTDNAGWNNRPGIELLADSEQAVGVRVKLDGIHDHVFQFVPGRSARIGDYRLSGSVGCVVRDRRGTPVRMLLGNGIMLSDKKGKRVLIKARRPNTTVAVAYFGQVLTLYGENLRGLKVYAPGASSGAVAVNGHRVKARKSGNYVTLK